MSYDGQKEDCENDKEDCPLCIANKGKFYPDHTASSSCESGKRDHCTCDKCF